MTDSVRLQIFTPEKTALDKMVHRVVLPYGKINLTIIPERAPTSLVLHAGPIKILDAQNKETELYFTDGGVADVAQNLCKISVRHLIRRQDISAEQAEQLQKEEPQNAAFYKMIQEYMTAFE